jgi:hypothetical protein
MNQRRFAEAVEAAAKALHESVRDPHQFRWENMTEEWRAAMRAYVQPCVAAALKASDDFGTRRAERRPLSIRPRLETISR